jgi:hypothetical protein
VNAGLLILLALLWAVFLLPGALRARQSSPTSSVGTFERAMSTLGRRHHGRTWSRREGRYVYVPSDAAMIVGDRARRRREVLERRRRIFVRLMATTGVIFPFAVFVGGAFWMLLVASSGALAVYAGLLRRWKLQADQAAEVVRELPDVEVAREVAEEHQGARVAAGAEIGAGHGLQTATHPDDPWAPQSGVRIRRFDDTASRPG